MVFSHMYVSIFIHSLQLTSPIPTLLLTYFKLLSLLPSYLLGFSLFLFFYELMTFSRIAYGSKGVRVFTRAQTSHQRPCCEFLSLFWQPLTA